MTHTKKTSAANKPSDRPSSHRLFLLVGSLGYLGFAPVASGTISVAVVGIPLYWVLIAVLDLGYRPYLAIIVALTGLAIWLSGRVDQLLGEKDSSKNVIDEIPGFLIALIAVPPTWQLVLAAFLLERAIDIAKIWPANWIERKLPGGWGVVLDDVVAGLYTLAILQVAVAFVPAWVGLSGLSTP